MTKKFIDMPQKEFVTKLIGGESDFSGIRLINFDLSGYPGYKDFLLEYLKGRGNKDGYYLDIRESDLRGFIAHEFYAPKLHATGANISGSDFYLANLKEAWFDNTNLIGSKFSGANLESAVFIDANLTRSVLIKANLYSADFFRANLTEADLKEAFLLNAFVKEADFSNADLRHIENLHSFWVRDLRSAKLDGAKISPSPCSDIQFHGRSYFGAVVCQDQTL